MTTPKHPWIGRPVYVRTLGEQWIGRLVEVTALELVLTEASWVADTGQVALTAWYGVYRQTNPSNDHARDVQRFPQPVRIGRGHVVSWTLFAGEGETDHRLPAESEVIQ